MKGLEIIRWECNYLRKSNDWILVYGRRKTGKTWLLRRCVKWILYITVTRGGNCIVEDNTGRRFMDCDEAMNKALETVKRRENIVIIDEFQRLPEKYWDLISLDSQERRGRLILCGSSIGILKRIFNRGSPLLGIVSGFYIDLASVSDTIASLAEKLPPRQALLWAPIARDPWIIPHIDFTREPWLELMDKSRILIPVVQGLVGEVFLEEERQLTRVYEALLRLLALRVWNIKLIAHRLYSLGLTSSPQPSSVTGLLHVMEKMGLVTRLPLWKTRYSRIYYMHNSPLLAMLLYLDEETGGSEWEASLEAVRTRYSIEVQFTLGRLLAEYHGLRQAYTILPRDEGDIDVVLLDRRGNPVIGYEVKIGPVTRNEALRTVENISRLGIPRAGVISLTEKPETGVSEEYGPMELIKVAVETSRRREY